LIVFLIWLYTGWLIFLVGAEITYFHQYPSAFVREALTGGRGYRFQEWLALSALVEITRRHFSDEPPWEQTELAARFGVSNLETLIDDFVRAGILLRSAEPEGVALARPPESVTVKNILEIVSDSAMQDPKEAGPVADILPRRHEAVQKALEGLALKSLVEDNRSTILKFPYPGSLLSRAEGSCSNRPTAIDSAGSEQTLFTTSRTCFLQHNWFVILFFKRFFDDNFYAGDCSCHSLAHLLHRL
jgi:DNA-binding IscR family transcriptional regulator